jgi:hypothetical protein
MPLRIRRHLRAPFPLPAWLLSFSLRVASDLCAITVAGFGTIESDTTFYFSGQEVRGC